MLYLRPRGAAEILRSEIAAAGWQVYPADDAPQAKGLIHSHDFHVGLAVFGSGETRVPYDIEDCVLASSASMAWVGLLPPDGLQSAPIRKLIRETFYDYHTLPTDPNRLLATLGHAYGMAALKKPLPTPDTQDADKGEYEMVGSSDVMLALFRAIRKAAGVDAPVLITGESGTGKELAARAIHERSPRAKGPFIAVNCGALPPNLIQSELFGHEKGSFTGAHQRKIGRVEAAAGGTIFLDEIGDLSLELQVNLLRFLQEKTIERVGGTEHIPVDVRVIAATHVDLDHAVEEKRFREDLYYRLNVLQLKAPALRERSGDIELLARFFFDKFAAERNKAVQGFSQQALYVMNHYEWPDNVRELINRIRHAMVMCENRLITPGDLGLERRTSKRQLITLEEARALAEKQAIQSCLRATRNNISLAARQLGVSRVTLYRLLEKYNLTA